MSRLAALALLLSFGCRPNDPVPPVATQPGPGAAGVGPPPPGGDGVPMPRPVPVRSRHEALSLGVDYLLQHQSPDGAWRSDVYATFKGGVALTPLVVTALQEAHDAGVRSAAVEAAITKGCALLAGFSKAGGPIQPPADGFDYPVYTAALTLKAFSHATATDFAKHRGAWAQYLKDRQLTEKLGWKPGDKPYGGWGYCRVIPTRPEPGALAPGLIESNLSATLFALEALAAAGEADPQVTQAAASFVRSCQNADGGFHFIYDDPTRNKAGAASADPLLFYSYGSTTADGLRALALSTAPDAGAGPETGSGRRAACAWLVGHFRADRHPGTYVRAHEPNRDAVYYYYAASLARAFRDHKLALPNGRDWAAELTAALAARQAPDGSWANPIELVRENDPIVATSSAALALARCRK